MLYAYVEGEFELEAAKEHFLEIISDLEKHRCEKILIDGRGVVGEPEPVERFFYGAFAAEAVAQFKKRHMRDSLLPFAYVLKVPTLDPRRLAETTARNRGRNIKAFDNIDEAFEWLKLAPKDLLDS